MAIFPMADRELHRRVRVPHNSAPQCGHLLVARISMKMGLLDRYSSKMYTMTSAARNLDMSIAVRPVIRIETDAKTASSAAVSMGASRTQ